MRLQRFSGTGGFVPVELLAVVTVMILLFGIAWPAVGRGEARSRSIVCRNNHREIIIAWQMYAQANNGECANNYTLPGVLDAISSKRFDNWANNVMTWAANSDLTSQSVTNEAWVAKGSLHTYTKGGIDLYQCPSDNFLSAPQLQRGYKKRLRSFSMNTVVGRPEPRLSPNSERSWAFGGAYRQWLKIRSITDPAMTFVTLDEHPDSINDGMFIVDTAADSWQDIPGALHDRATSFSFADGHVETRKWRSRRNVLPVRFNYVQPPTFDAEGRKDFAWYISRAGLVRF